MAKTGFLGGINTRGYTPFNLKLETDTSTSYFERNLEMRVFILADCIIQIPLPG